ncbi:ferritin-like domain-containing protein [Gammaproteobacteria bacterium LSUCC0112]|nr:ferritin-like domain-containing protein [Gammaproteobacteria bacterium LSUCC0112]
MSIFLNYSNNFELETTPESFTHHCHGSILWNPHTKDQSMNLTCARLNKIAENKRWNPATDIDWIFRTGNQQFPCIPDANPLVGFDEYEKLPIDTRRQISWRYHKMEISEILHGEQLAMLCASQLMTLMPCMESRLFTSRQAADEARHFEFFRDYLDSVDLSVCPPSPALKRLTVEALQSPHWEIKLLICQVLIESLAMAQFSQLARTTQVTSLRQGLRRILDDEARHVKFGADYLAAHFQHHNADNIIVLSNYIMLEITSLRRPLNWPRPTIIVSPSPLLFVGTSINYAIICADNESTTRHSYNRDSGNFLSISRR